MRVLQVKDRPTTLARALAELGRIIKTLHRLGYVDSKEKRRRIPSSTSTSSADTPSTCRQPSETARSGHSATLVPNRTSA